MFGFVVVKKFDLHLGHVHPSGAVALAAFAAHTQVKRFLDLLADHGVGSIQAFELPGQGQSQGVGPPTCEVFFVARDAVTRAHRAGVELSAVAVVVAHLHRFGETLRRVATRAGRGSGFGDRVVLHVPDAPVERGLDGNDFVCGRETHQRRIVHPGRVHHAFRAEQIERIHQRLDLPKRLRYVLSKLPFNPLAPAQAVTVLAAVSPFELTHKGAGFFGDGAHFQSIPTAHVQNRPHMQGAHTRVSVPGAARAMAGKHLGKRVGVFRQVLQGHSAIFNEAHRFAVTLQTHHDVQAGFANLPQRFLRSLLGHLHHATGQAQVGHQFDKLFQFWKQSGAVSSREFD